MAAYRRYRGWLAERFDVVVDEVNTIPFMTPLWCDVPSVMFIHQLAREVWWYETRFPLSSIGYIAESLYLRCYRRAFVITVSASTRDDLKEIGFKGPIAIVPEGIEPITSVEVTRPQTPRFLYVGRLAPSKRVGDILEAFAKFCRSVGRGELRLLGDGSATYVEKLHAQVRRLDLGDQVQFLGHVSMAEKHREMAGAHMLLLASAREGWGLVVTEANAFGTPAVAYNVAGLRDSIKPYETGLLTQPTPQALGSAMTALWQDKPLFERLSKAAKAGTLDMSFDLTATTFRRQLDAAVASHHSDRADRGNRQRGDSD